MAILGTLDFKVQIAGGSFVKVGTISLTGTVSANGQSITNASWTFTPVNSIQQGPWNVTATYNASSQNFTLSSSMNPVMMIPSGLADPGNYSALTATLVLSNQHNLETLIGTITSVTSPPTNVAWQASPTFGPWKFNVQSQGSQFVEVGTMSITANVNANGQSITDAVWSFTAKNGTQQGPWAMTATYNGNAGGNNAFGVMSSMSPNAMNIPPGLTDPGDYQQMLNSTLTLDNNNGLVTFSGSITSAGGDSRPGGASTTDVAWEATSTGDEESLETQTAYCD